MKKTILILSLFISVTSIVLASEQTYTYPKNVPADTAKNSPEAKAMQHATYMEQKLKLTGSQKQQVYNLTLDKVKNTAALKTKYKGDAKAAQPELNQLRTKYDSSIKSVLTADQQTKWKQILEDQKINAQQPARLNEYDPTILDSQW